MRPLYAAILGFALGLLLAYGLLVHFAPSDTERLEEREARDRPLLARIDSLNAVIAGHVAERDSLAAESRSDEAAAEVETRVVYVTVNEIREEDGRDYAPLSPDSLSALATATCEGAPGARGHVSPLGVSAYIASRSCVEDYVRKGRQLPLYARALAASERRDSLRVEALRDERAASASCSSALAACEAVADTERVRAEAWRRTAYEVARENRLSLSAAAFGGYDVAAAKPLFEGSLDASLRLARFDLMVGGGVATHAPGGFVRAGVRFPLF